MCIRDRPAFVLRSTVENGLFRIGFGNSLEGFSFLDKSGDDIRIEMQAAAFDDDFVGLFERHGGLVNSPADQRIENVGQRHQAGRNRNRTADKPNPVARAIPFCLRIMVVDW